jgi:hypothetical protein
METIIKSSLIGSAISKAFDTATLDRAGVTFILPDGDDRDHDTVTSIQLKKQDGKAIAGDGDVAPGQHFKDPGTYGPYNLPVQTPVSLADYKGGFCEFTIQPNGHDHWITNVVILAHFSDGTIVHSESGTVGLDQDHNSMRFGL